MHTSSETKILSLVLALGLTKRPITNIKEFKSIYSLADDLAITDITRVLREEGVLQKHLRCTASKIRPNQCPAIFFCKNGSARLLLSLSEGRYLIQDPANQAPPTSISLREFSELYDGEIISLKTFSEEDSKKKDNEFGPALIFKSLSQNKALVTEIIVASLFIQIFALTMPLFMQVVIDKVMLHQGYDTLDVLAFGLICVIIFEALLNALRSYLFSHTSFQADMQFGVGLFRKLIHLPLNYYRARTTGETASRVKEADNIRTFLTGATIPTSIDLIFAVVFLIVMYAFSPTLTFIVMASLPFYFLISFVLSPILQKRLAEKSQLAASSQSFLVETVSNIETLKSLSAERNLEKKWEKKLIETTKSAFRSSQIQALSTQGTQFIQKAVMVATLYVGSLLVLNMELTVGGMVAFNMLSSRVAMPISGLFKVWQEYQQMKVSMERLRDIMERDTETSHKTNMDVHFDGDISFRGVTFSYPSQKGHALKDISFDISSGFVTGIVGPSGSGKSTLVRLLQVLHYPEQGDICIDGLNIAKLDVATVRSQIGVVLQDNHLLSGSVMDNIRLGNSEASDEDVIEAAKLAGAHDFIENLEHSYRTQVGESGSNLSGGQRQKIAIARALVRQPSLLIFDEATSALDADSEYEIVKNMKTISKGRTVIIIAHRLSTVRHSDHIYFIEDGAVHEHGTHDSLFTEKGAYWRYCQKQAGDFSVESIA